MSRNSTPDTPFDLTLASQSAAPDTSLAVDNTLPGREPERIRSAPSTPMSLERTLLEMQKDLVVSRREIAMLAASNAELRRQLENAIQQEAEARVYAYRDELTGLPNRRLLKDRIQIAIHRAARDGRWVALLMIDLDDFKHVNDTLGHAAGDQLLRLVAARLKTCTRACDTASRYGGDEFVVLLSDMDRSDAIFTVAQKIQACLDEPYVIHGNPLRVRASIGCAAYPEDGDTFQDLVERADAEMYRVKAKRRLG